MTGEFEITPTKTYATLDNARKAVAKTGDEKHRHFFMTNSEGRYFPVFVGIDNVHYGVHFRWNVIN